LGKNWEPAPSVGVFYGYLQNIDNLSMFSSKWRSLSFIVFFSTSFQQFMA
jgi:hypothetical protein